MAVCFGGLFEGLMDHRQILPAKLVRYRLQKPAIGLQYVEGLLTGYFRYRSFAGWHGFVAFLFFYEK